MFYARPGLDAAVAATVRRLHLNLLNQPLPDAGMTRMARPVPQPSQGTARHHGTLGDARAA